MIRRCGPAAAALLLACSPAAATPSGADTAETVHSHGLDTDGVDRSVAPGDDFFRYANGLWLKSTEVPPDRSSWGIDERLEELTSQRTVELIQGVAASVAAGSGARRIGDYYASFMDEAAIERLGLKPLEEGLARIEAIRDRAGLARALGHSLRADVDVLNNGNVYTENVLGLWVAQDLDNPSRYSPFLLQGGLGMPDRDYYLNPSMKMAEIRASYLSHIEAVLKLAQVADAHDRAAHIFALEHAMAEGHASREESEQVQKGNNHWSLQDFAQRAPGLNWTAFFATAGLSQQKQFVVWQPHAVTALAALVAGSPLEVWKDYLRFHLIEGNCEYLPKAFVAEHFAFHERIVQGTPQLAPRWKRAVAETNAALGDAVGKLYVERYFPASEKARAQALVKNLIAAFAVRIDDLEWMTPATRAQAKAKLATLKVGVGYPDKWLDYSALEVARGDAFGNAERAQLFEYRRNLARLGQPVDRDEWVMNPQLVNAVNLPAMNALNFPAAILQPPYFDPAQDPAIDYGATGFVIGHEISHSFDDQGAQFDADGRLRNWWTAQDYAHFQAAGRRLVEQFSAYHPFPDLSVNGKQTLGENIADVAGLSAAYDAWRLTLAARPAASSQDLRADRLFFLSYAQTWRRKFREPELRRRIVTDAHAPAEYRADTVRNLDPWYEAFGVQAGARLYLAPAERVRLW